VWQDITDSFQEDLRGAVGKLEQVVEEKKAMELEFDDSLRDLEDKHDKVHKHERGRRGSVDTSARSEHGSIMGHSHACRTHAP
jgi:hypothetical protein